MISHENEILMLASLSLEAPSERIFAISRRSLSILLHHSRPESLALDFIRSKRHARRQRKTKGNNFLNSNQKNEGYRGLAWFRECWFQSLPPSWRKGKISYFALARWREEFRDTLKLDNYSPDRLPG